MSARERIVMLVVYIVGLFLALSMVAQFALLWAGRLDAAEGVWRPMFDLMAVLVGAIGGYIARDAMNGHHKDDE